MCPACLGTIATVAMITSGAGSVSGLTALIVKKLRVQNDSQKVERKSDAKPQASEEKSR